MAFREAWSIVDGEVLEAPPHIELQVQHQLLVSGLQWALIVALIGGNRVSMIERSYDPEIGAAILRKVREFWQLVDQGTPPAPDYTRDAATIAHLYVESTAGKVLDCREDAHLAAWVTRHQSLGEQVRQYTKERDELKARILERVGDASRILLPDYATLACGTVRESIVPEHVRGAYRNLRFYQRKDKQS
jgi:predicted phage-related endonuclease